jgi:hypothetical protein
VRHGPGRPSSHAALARLTGQVPDAKKSQPITDLDEILALAAAHPYDPWANYQAARALSSQGQPEAASQILNNSVWFSDRDLSMLDASLALLRQIDPAWATRRIVRVHCYADESVREDPHWRWRLRLLWLTLSRALGPILDTAFVPVSLKAFRSERGGPDLLSIDAAMRRQVDDSPEQGIVAVFTQRSVPSDGREWRSGQAELLGERMVIRLVPETTMSRTMVHETLHLYGGVHLSTEFDSLMNPGGGSLQVDELNLRIALLTRERRFYRDVGIEGDVLRYTDSDELLAAYLQLLEFNLRPRNRDLLRANDESTRSKALAAQLTWEATELDDHMAQVSEFLGRLYLRRNRLEDARNFYELAAKLHGLGTVEGQAAREEVRRIRQTQRRERRQESR